MLVNARRRAKRRRPRCFRKSTLRTRTYPMWRTRSFLALGKPFIRRSQETMAWQPDLPWAALHSGQSRLRSGKTTLRTTTGTPRRSPASTRTTRSTRGSPRLTSRSRPRSRVGSRVFATGQDEDAAGWPRPDLIEQLSPIRYHYKRDPVAPIGRVEPDRPDPGGQVIRKSRARSAGRGRLHP